MPHLKQHIPNATTMHQPVTLPEKVNQLVKVLWLASKSSTSGSDECCCARLFEMRLQAIHLPTLMTGYHSKQLIIATNAPRLHFYCRVPSATSLRVVQLPIRGQDSRDTLMAFCKKGGVFTSHRSRAGDGFTSLFWPAAAAQLLIQRSRFSISKIAVYLTFLKLEEDGLGIF